MPAKTKVTPSSSPSTVVSHLAIQDMDLTALEEAQHSTNVYKISATDLDHEALLHPDDGLGREETFEVVIVHAHPGRQRYSGDYDAATVSPPLCASWDGVTGYGSPGGICAHCKFAEYKSECDPVYQIYGLLVDGTLPVRISVPPTSLRSVRKFLSRAPFEIGKPLTSFVTTFRAVKREKGEGKVLMLSKGADLAPDAAAAAKLYAAGFRAILAYPTLSGGPGSPQLADPTAARAQLPAGQRGDASYSSSEDEALSSDEYYEDAPGTAYNSLPF